MRASSDRRLGGYPEEKAPFPHLAVPNVARSDSYINTAVARVATSGTIRAVI